MAEAVGLAVGLVSLSSLFTSILDISEVDRVIENYDEDCKFMVVSLDLLMLRFQRWGEAAGVQLRDEVFQIEHLQYDDDSMTCRLLMHMKSLFDNAETILQPGSAPDPGSPRSYVRKVRHDRKAQLIRATNKMKWVAKDSANLKDIYTKARDLMGSLEKMKQPDQSVLDHLAKVDAVELAKGPAQGQLMQALEDSDPALVPLLQQSSGIVLQGSITTDGSEIAEQGNFIVGPQIAPGAIVSGLRDASVISAKNTKGGKSSNIRIGIQIHEAPPSAK